MTVNPFVYDLVLALTGIGSGRSCRRCATSISPGDLLGQSEGVCPGCRL